MAATNRQDVEKEIKDLASVAEVAFKNISTNIKDIFTDALSSGEKVLSSLSKDMQRNINSLAKDSNNLIVNQSKINKGLITSKDINKQLLDNENKLYLLEQQRASTIKVINDDILLSEEDKLALTEDINKEYSQSIDYNKILVDKLKEQAEQTKLIEKRTGITAKTLMGLKKIPILGDILNIDKGLENMSTKALETGNVFKLLGAGIKGAFEGIEKASVILALIAAAKKLYDFIKGAMLNASKQIADFQRNLGVSRDSASEIRDRFYEISDNAKILAQTQTGNLILQKDLVEAQESFNTALGLAVDLSTKQNEEFTAQFTNIKKFYNLNEQEQKGLVNLNATNNKTLDETKNSILGQTALYRINTKEAINIRKVFKEVLTTSNATKLSIKGGGDALVKSVINAQKLGVTLDSLGKIADNLLNFEESISSELEAELILGRDLELEKARAAALMNDQVTLTEEVNRLVKDAGPDFEKNRIAMQASAKAIGIGVDELADMVTQQRVVEKFKQNFQALDEKAIENSKTLSKDEKKRLKENKGTAEDYYKFAKEQGKDLVQILGDEQASRMEAQDAQQKFNDALEKAKETFSSFVDSGALDKFADFLVKFVESVGIQGFATTLFTGLADDTDIAEAKVGRKQEEINMESDPEKKKQLQDDLAKLQIEKDKTEYETEKKRLLAGRESLIKQGYNTGQADLELARLEQNKPKFAKGGITVKPIYNATVGEAGPEAIIPLHRLPEMLNTNGTNDEAMNKMVALLSQQNTLLASINNKEGTIVLEGTKIGTAMNVGGYKVV